MTDVIKPTLITRRHSVVVQQGGTSLTLQRGRDDRDSSPKRSVRFMDHGLTPPSPALVRSTSVKDYPSRSSDPSIGASPAAPSRAPPQLMSRLEVLRRSGASERRPSLPLAVVSPPPTIDDMIGACRTELHKPVKCIAPCPRGSEVFEEAMRATMSQEDVSVQGAGTTSSVTSQSTEGGGARSNRANVKPKLTTQVPLKLNPMGRQGRRQSLF